MTQFLNLMMPFLLEDSNRESKRSLIAIHLASFIYKRKIEYMNDRRLLQKDTFRPIVFRAL